MNETGLGRDSFWPFIENCCADEHRSEEDLQTTEDEMCLVRCGGLLATERAGMGGENAGLLVVKEKDKLFFFGPMPPHVLCGLRGPPSWAWQECYRLLRLGRP